MHNQERSEEEMEAKIGQCPLINPDLVQSDVKNGTSLSSNEVGKPLLHELDMKSGKYCIQILEIWCKGVISQNGLEK